MRGKIRDQPIPVPRRFVDPVKYAQRAMREETRAMLQAVDRYIKPEVDGHG